MKAFGNERGAEMMAFAERVLFELPDGEPVGEKGYVNYVPSKVQVWIELNRYAIGKHANQSDRTAGGAAVPGKPYARYGRRSWTRRRGICHASRPERGSGPHSSCSFSATSSTQSGMGC